MTLFGRTISRMALGILGVILIIALIAFGTSQCQKRRNAAAQARVDASQAIAAQDSAKDAIGTVTAAGARETASEQLSRDNEREIRAADGAGERVKPGVANAGRAALCRRQAYANDPRCKGVKR